MKKKFDQKVKIKKKKEISKQVNVWREDRVINSQMLSQADALAEAKRSYLGYFVVPLILRK
jgi:Asp-tRNA(Asn)/Glu-tRNA(Gln) amidotransferase C subunit